MKIDFKNIVIRDIEGNEENIDMSKELGKILYRSAISKEGLELAKNIYDNGEAELDKDAATSIKGVVSNGFLAIVQESVIPMLDEIINSENNDQQAE